MRILFLTQRLPYAPNRGDRIRAYYLLREMSRFASVSLFSFAHDDDEAARAGSMPFAKHVACARVTRVRNLVLGAARLASRRPLTHSLLDATGAQAALETLVRSSPPDVVVAYCSSMARFALEPPLDGRPFVLDMVDVDSAKWRQLAEGTSGPRRWIYRREASTLGAFEAHASRRARNTLVVNARERSALLEIAPDAEVTVLPIGIDLNAFTPGTEAVTDPVVIFCGVMNYAPNDEGVRWFVQEAWPRVRAARPDARFLILGPGPTRALKAAAVRDSSIEIIGAVAAVQPFLWRSAVSVAPLHLARGVQNKVLEALAAKLPAVVTPAVWEGLPEEARPGCATAEGAADFATAVVRLLDMPAAERRRHASSARLDRMGWSERLAPLEAILRNASQKT